MFKKPTTGSQKNPLVVEVMHDDASIIEMNLEILQK